MNPDLPLVSFIVVARNAEKHLDELLSDILAQDYPKNSTEYLFVDSQSTDCTKLKFERFKKDNPALKIKILDNPQRILASGWNIALKNSDGEIIVRVDAHSRIEKNFVSKNVETILRGENIVGGCRISKPHESIMGHIIYLSSVSKFGSGQAKYRNMNPDQYVDTLAHAAYKRAVFRCVGGYDERLARNQDYDIHCRMRKA
ncbi:MAG: glycosyltransferase, partial [Elusimicrobia bacterium]|nr:glycosyltransferase [Elusimicrobiota bacterium]